VLAQEIVEEVEAAISEFAGALRACEHLESRSR